MYLSVTVLTALHRRWGKKGPTVHSQSDGEEGLEPPTCCLCGFLEGCRDKMAPEWGSRGLADIRDTGLGKLGLARGQE